MKPYLLFAFFACFLSSALALTEDELLEQTAQSLELVRQGKISQLQQLKDTYRLVSSMSPSYRQKADNLRMIGARIDILEAVEAKQITPEKGQRLIAEDQANVDERELVRKEAEEAANRQRQQSWDAQYRAELQRRAAEIRMIENSRPPPYQLPMPPMMGPKIRCNSNTLGNNTTTECR